MQKNRYTYRFLIRFFTLLSFILVFANISNAKHIIGGDMTYVCNGNGNYTITLKVYRDCASGGANYDNPANFGIYRGSTLLMQRTANTQNVGTIEPDDNPCVQVSNPPCVQTATYSFDVTLQSSSQTYTISYQRCCRNETINNIVNPGDMGVTYTVEITPESQESCNNSPVFNDFPPIIICSGYYLGFDHSASDAEGDELVYSFCSPLRGGGSQGTAENPGDPNGPNGVQPIPPTGPPYNTVAFLTPTYSSSNPMAGSPQISIDPVTGIITGIPTALGQFVVGVCVEEYRNGVLIGEIQRDFQFNVINCNPVVNANIVEDEIIGDKEFLINLCGDFSFEFINESTSSIGSISYEWNFDLGNGTTFDSSEEDVLVTFPDLGSYQGTLIVNPGLECTDTAKIYVNVFPEINADLAFDYDTCIADAVEFSDLSVTGAGDIAFWDWNFGDGNFSGERDPSHEYLIPGVFDVVLTVRDTNECEDRATAVLSYFPAPESLVIDLDGFVGCAPETVLFDNLSFPIDTNYTINWDFGDGTSSNEISPVHFYGESGIYSVSLNVISPIGCEVAVPYNASIEINESPEAGFSFTPEMLTNFQPEAFFTDESSDAVAWQWNFGDGSIPVYEMNPSHTYDPGTYEIMQVVRHQSGCLDTAVATIKSELLVTYHLPNAFTPNSDSKNEVFKGTGFLEGMTGFEMTIWNRWGEQIFLTNDPEQGWNGRKNNAGPILQNSVYVVLVKYTEPAGGQISRKGFVTLIR